MLKTLPCFCVVRCIVRASCAPICLWSASASRIFVPRILFEVEVCTVNLFLVKLLVTWSTEAAEAERII